MRPNQGDGLSPTKGFEVLPLHLLLLSQASLGARADAPRSQPIIRRPLFLSSRRAYDSLRNRAILTPVHGGESWPVLYPSSPIFASCATPGAGIVGSIAFSTSWSSPFVRYSVTQIVGEPSSWRAIALWGRTHQTWLKRFLAIPNGIPSHDTFRRLFERLDGTVFQTCIRQWLLELSGVLKVSPIAIDGKTLRGSGSSTLGPLHLVSAWATQYHLSLGQVAVDAKSNEITAIPQLLEALNLHGALVTIDAMGCQKAIAKKIVERGGHYALTVKDNQRHLREDIEQCVGHVLERASPLDTAFDNSGDRRDALAGLLGCVDQPL
jgi:predicted transposase YbfD/YdcC